MALNEFNWQFQRRIGRTVSILGKNEVNNELYVLDLHAKRPFIIDVTGTMSSIRVQEGETYKILFDIFSANVPKEYLERIKKTGDKEIMEAIKNLRLLRNRIYKFVLVDIYSKYHEFDKKETGYYLDRLMKTGLTLGP